MPEIENEALEDCDEDIAELYLKTATRSLKNMEAAARSGSMVDIQRLAHKLSGASAFLGLKEMTRLLCALEKASAQSLSRDVERNLRLLKEEFSQVRSRFGVRVS